MEFFYIFTLKSKKQMRPKSKKLTKSKKVKKQSSQIFKKKSKKGRTLKRRGGGDGHSFAGKSLYPPVAPAEGARQIGPGNRPTSPSLALYKQKPFNL